MMSALTSNLTIQDQHRRYNVLKNYFTGGCSHKEICNFLFRFHRIKITIQHLKQKRETQAEPLRKKKKSY